MFRNFSLKQIIVAIRNIKIWNVTTKYNLWWESNKDKLCKLKICSVAEIIGNEQIQASEQNLH